MILGDGGYDVHLPGVADAWEPSENLGKYLQQNRPYKVLRSLHRVLLHQSAFPRPVHYGMHSSQQPSEVGRGTVLVFWFICPSWTGSSLGGGTLLQNERLS